MTRRLHEQADVEVGGLGRWSGLAAAQPTMALGCECAACRSGVDGGEASGDGLGGLDGSKPIWSNDQVVGNFLRSNAAWTPGATITYSFRQAKPAGADADIQFKAFDAIEREHTRLSFDLISDIVNLTFVEAPDDFRSTNVSNRIYFGKDTDAPQFEWGHARRWSVDGGGGRRLITSAEVWVSDTAQATRQWFAGGYNFQALMHEALHTLGIPHPGDYNADGNPITYAANAQYAQDSRQFSIMSYFAASNTGSDHTVDSKGGIYSGATPLLHDVMALQALYGANTSTRAGDTTYGYNSTAGRAALDFTLNTTPIFTIWDGGGIDKLDFSQTQFRVNLDLNAGAFSDSHEMTNNISIAFGVVIENAVGGSAGDRMLGNGAANRLEGAGGNDELLGAGGNDRLEGGDGDDALRGGEGDDFLDGGQGRDNMFGAIGNDHLVGGIDDDRLHGEDGDDLMGGQDGNDYLDGGEGRDTLFGDGGNDQLIGLGGDDRLFGQDGDDLIGGSDGADFIDGGNGRDLLYGDGGFDHMIGGADDDRIFGQDGDDLIGGQDGNDFIDGGQGRDTLFGDGGNDHILGGIDDDRLFGQDGDDLIGGQDGFDFIDGGRGRDRLFGDGGNDHILGGADDDALYGQDGDDAIGGQDGFDFIDGGQGRDNLFGDGGNDHLLGGADNDRLHGNDGDDLIGGQDGDDYIEGGGGRDTLFGDAGNDVIFGGDGGDSLTGNAGADRFLFNALSQSGGGERDRINDFNAGEGDLIDLSGIDADVFASGDQAFTFVGGFSGRAGEAVLSFNSQTNLTILSLDVNGDRLADFSLELAGNVGPGGGFVV